MTFLNSAVEVYIVPILQNLGLRTISTCIHCWWCESACMYAIICCRTSRDVIIVLSQHFNANVNLHDLQYLLHVPAYLYMYM